MSLLVQGAYAALFLGAGLLALVGIYRTRRVGNPAVRRSLLGLLVVAKLWVLAELVRVLAPPGPLGAAAYVAGLVLGLAAVGAWLYFASAYTGRSWHRDRRLRVGAVVAFLLVAAVKVTNPVHGAYFVTAARVEPFPHLAVSPLAPHWVAVAGAYLLAIVGLAAVGRTLARATDDDGVTAILLLAVAVPGLFTLLGETTDLLLSFTYEPIGVVLFAVGALSVADGSLLSVDRIGRRRAFEELDQPVVITDDAGRVREYNPAAETLLSAVVGETNAGRLRSLLDDCDPESPVSVDIDGEERWFIAEVSPLRVGTVDAGRAYLLSDVTDVERSRRELARQNEQLAELNVAVQHELRNTLTTLFGYTQLARDDLASGASERVPDHLDVVASTAERMETTVEDLSTLTRLGQTIERRVTCRLGRAVERGRDRFAADADRPLEVVVGRDATLEAHQLRLERLFENVFRFAAHNDATTIRVDAGEDGFTVRDDGQPLSAADPDEAFDFGGVVPDAAAGTVLPTARLLASAHGWNVTVDENYEAGVSLVFTGADVDPVPEAGVGGGRISADGSGN